MIKKFLMLVFVAAMMLSFVGCSLALPEGEVEDGQQELTFTYDKMVGMFVVVYDGQTPLTPVNLESDDAIKYYLAQEKYAQDSNSTYLKTVMGREVFSNISCEIASLDGSDSLSLQMDMQYTHELVGALVAVYGVYEDRETKEYYAEEGGNMYTLGEIDTGATIEQTLTASSTDADGEEQISYECSVHIDFTLVDNLTSVRLIQFDASNNVLATDIHTYGNDNRYVAQENCAYVVIEENYEVVYDYQLSTVKYEGMTYQTRIILDRPLGEQSQTVLFCYPEGDGFIESDYISVMFE